MNDFELLREYADRDSQDAFTTLVARYVNLVYSAALRQTSRSHDADEVAQAVFLILARKAGSLRPDSVLSGWLLKTTRFVALNAQRKESHRKRTEQEAMNLQPAEADAVWKKIAPLLDEALFKLSEQDRAAVALRYFEDKSFKEIGQTLGTSDDLAQKRVSRAVEKLRAHFTGRGVALSAAVATGVIAGHSVQAAPQALSAQIVAHAIGGATGSAATLAAATLAAWRATFIRRLTLQAATVALVVTTVWLLGHESYGKMSKPTAAAIGATEPGPDTGTNASAPQTATAAVTSRPGSNSLRFRVLDALDQAPLTATRLTLVQQADPIHQITNIVTTASDGTAFLPLEPIPYGDWNYRIEVYRDGYVPRYVSWSANQGDEFNDIPVEYTTALNRAASIGGTVVDETGVPVAGARIEFSVFSPKRTVERERPTFGAEYHVETTDSDGHWQCDHVPEQFGMIMFEVYHPNYVHGQFGSAALGAAANNGVTYVSATDLRQGKATMTVHHGEVAAGVVVDESGNPVAGARVTFNQSFGEPAANRVTGPDGRFHFANMGTSPGQAHGSVVCFLTAQAEGYAPTDVRFDQATPPAESTLVMVRGAPLRGKVLDEVGRPVRNACIQISSHSNVRRFEWQTLTDADGKFEWLSAPPGQESYVVVAAGYEPIPEVKWAADGNEHVVKLESVRPIRFSGTVVDSEGRQPLDDFEVWMSSTERAETGYGRPMSEFRPAQRRAVGHDGQFSFTNRSLIQSYTLEVRANRYWIAEKNGGPVTEDTRFDFELSRAPSFASQVRLPDGTPVANATAMLCTEGPKPSPELPQPGPRNGVQMTRPGEFDVTRSGAAYAMTDTQGRFSFAPQSDAKKILVAAPAGFASVDVGETGAPAITTLKPWGRITGMLKIGALPGANETIDLNYMDIAGEWTGYYLALQTKTDADGNFTFEGVPPGPLDISHRLSFRDGQLGAIPQTQQRRILVKAGETTQVVLGGSGRKVVGKLKINDSDRAIDWRFDVQYMTLRVPGAPVAPNRQDFASQDEYMMSNADYISHSRRFGASEAGQQAALQKRRYVLEFEQDGSFKIEDVEPGAYDLQIKLSNTNAPMQGAYFGSASAYQAIAQLKKVVTVPAMVNGAPVEPFDLGVIELTNISGR